MVNQLLLKVRAKRDLRDAQKAQMSSVLVDSLELDVTQLSLYIKIALGAQLREKFKSNNLDHEVFGIYMKTSKGKLLRISDVLKSGIQLETDEVGK